MSIPEPWPPEKRDAKKRKIDKEAVRAAKRLGASRCVIIAFFDEGTHTHLLDGKSDPHINMLTLYSSMVTAVQTLQMSGGEDVSFN